LVRRERGERQREVEPGGGGMGYQRHRMPGARCA
jgi:hypothetical protein